MSALTYVGFFRELTPHAPAFHRGSLREALSPPGDYPADAVAGYLDAGLPVLDVMELTYDVVDGAFQVPGGSSVVTDGQFVWRHDLAPYVRHYAPALPEAFVARALTPPGVPAALPRDEMIALSGRIVAELGFRTS
ncbi:hypothetical protein [Streptomyces sedi]|uniref:Uncharacterized protein n=1 Tax=Streptomyces sedi TaxID=555059 RepID=A0A5C4VFB4_9ACTN|nr:hypothetical protein [Streptomyces sedi]TNM34521.1 hypothetical protein FH715_02305 [Streptomyces sedi]